MTTELETKPDTDLQTVPGTTTGDNIRASWNFSADNFHANCARYTPEAKEVLMSAFRWCIDSRHPISKPDFARRIGISDNTLYKIYTGKYRHPETNEQLEPKTDLLRSIRQFLTLEKERQLSGETQLVKTPTLNKICTACDLSRESRTIVFLVGPSHIGKTWALERYYAPQNNHGRTLYTRMHAASGLGGMVRNMADSVGVSDKSNTAALVERIKHAVTQDMLWILDEVHLLAHTYRRGSFHNCMEVIREIHDECRVGMVLSFTILDEVRAARQKELQQLWRRGVHKVILPTMPSKGDLTAIIEHNGLEFPDPAKTVQVHFKDAAGKRQTIEEKPYEIIRLVAKSEALLAITERFRYGRKLAQREGERLTWTHFVKAHLLIAKQAEETPEW